VREINSRRMRWVWNVARMGRGDVCTEIWWGNMRERDQWGESDIGRKIIIRRIVRKWEGVVGTGWSSLRIGRVGGHL
jgi:hypothetical protein